MKSENDVLFFFIGNKKVEKVGIRNLIYTYNLLLNKGKTMNEIYLENCDKEDGFLYISYSNQPGYGNDIIN